MYYNLSIFLHTRQESAGWFIIFCAPSYVAYIYMYGSIWLYMALYVALYRALYVALHGSLWLYMWPYIGLYMWLYLALYMALYVHLITWCTLDAFVAVSDQWVLCSDPFTTALYRIKYFTVTHAACLLHSGNSGNYYINCHVRIYIYIYIYI